MSENTKRIPIAAVVGPTASGKTALSVALAERMNAEIISCDSMQLYRRMMIGTARPTPEEQKGIVHHLIDCVDPETPFSAADYVSAAERSLEEIRERRKTPLFCGGTGLYLEAFLRGGFSEAADGDPTLRASLTEFFEENGKDALYARLAECDPEAAKTIHPNNVRRVIRALEICLSGGKTKTELDRENSAYRDCYAPTVVGLLWDRALLYERIDRRVDLMIKAGLIEETEQLLREGVFDVSETAAQAIGYKELLPYLRGECPLSEAVERLKTATRRYAKRQMTWFRAHGDVHWIRADRDGKPLKFEEIVNNAAKVFSEAGFVL
ncbi:MAG: tRNA (adenosine(37)-N6)-dimethylallyltransferase MiaA [Clostridia bacterium]|nr:tRNA (adenosine(37)-N6)-dimethylallyltransferase MiaA [Clostridia bacterium]MBR2908681.1 tRNA (adenosine(37)-N6)-dimethylallyltransferase MiaA [Clostridia bacterium]